MLLYSLADFLISIIDYFFIDAKLKSKIIDAFILTDVYGSDHCPIGIEITG